MSRKPMVYTGYIPEERPYELFKQFGMRDRDLLQFIALIESDRMDEAIDFFIQNYVLNSSDLYTENIVQYLNIAHIGELSENDKRMMSRAIIAFSGALALTLNSNFKVFVTKGLAPKVFRDMGIISGKVKKAILENTVSQFEVLTEGALAESRKEVLSYIRKLQKDVIIENQRLLTVKNLDKVQLEREVWNFKKSLYKRYPKYFKSMLNGRLIKTKRFGKHGEQVIYYGLDNYADTAVRTTLLNVDRTAVEVVAGIEGSKMFEYYLRDTRALKTGKERPICKEILRKKVFGRSILTTDMGIAVKLGIPLLDDVKAKGAMGVYCRHSIRLLSKAYIRKVYQKYKLKEAASC